MHACTHNNICLFIKLNFETHLLEGVRREARLESYLSHSMAERENENTNGNAPILRPAELIILFSGLQPQEVNKNSTTAKLNFITLLKTVNVDSLRVNGDSLVLG